MKILSVKEYLDIVEGRPYIPHLKNKNIIRIQKKFVKEVQVVGVKEIKNEEDYCVCTFDELLSSSSHVSKHNILTSHHIYNFNF